MQPRRSARFGVDEQVEHLADGPFPADRLAQRQVFLEPRGSERNDFFNQFDVRAEKAFNTAGHRFGLFADVFNLFNTATVTTRQPRYPNTTISGALVAYKAPTAVQGARQVTFGARWMF